MKQGTNCLLPISIGTDLALVKKIEFILKQNDLEMYFEYPSDKTIKDENAVNLIFTQQDTWAFKPNVAIYIDTRITLWDSDYQPETEIVSIKMSKTLFKPE